MVIAIIYGSITVSRLKLKPFCHVLRRVATTNQATGNYHKWTDDNLAKDEKEEVNYSKN